MKYVDEFRDGAAAQSLAAAIARTVTRAWTLMEVCGGQTHSIVRFGIDEILPPQITLVHGPGCPVCVTPIELIDKAIEIAMTPGALLASFGDMLRVPGSHRSLLDARAAGGSVAIVYSPFDAVKLAQLHSDKEVVFFAVGFETTAPANALAVRQAHSLGLKNFSLLVSHVLVPPAMEAILSAPNNRVQGFLAPGHVCTVVGLGDYEQLLASFKVPIVVTGFEPLDLLNGILHCVQQLESGRAFVENAYRRVVNTGGNPHAQDIVAEVFEVGERAWRGVGVLPKSGLKLREKYQQFNAEIRFGSAAKSSSDSGECISGEILRGLKKPHECPAFGTRCTPERPLGATMVSSEGACAAYYRYRRAGIVDKPA